MEKILLFRDGNIEKYFDRRGFERLQQVLAIPSVVPPVVVLPDFHFKKNMEAPSSIAVAAEGHIIPHLSSCSLNCGMGLIATGVESGGVTANTVGAFFDHLRRNRKDPAYDLTREEFNAVLLNGPKALQEKYDLPDAAIDAFENNGNVLAGGPATAPDIAKFIPDDLCSRKEYNAVTDVGIGFGGNHFLEIQKVSEARDESLSKKAGLGTMGQIVIMYHGGGGIVPGFIGGYFARRMKGYSGNIRLLYNKLKYHLPEAGDMAGVIDRCRYYFGRKRFVAVPEASREGKRVMLAHGIAMNYGYAYRLMMYVRIADAFAAVTGIDKASLSLIKDVSHNSIQKERIGGKDVWVHRHNACRIMPGEVAVLPGNNNTSSYACVGGANAKASLFTVPHGAGASIASYIDAGMSKRIDGKHTLIYRGEKRTAERVDQYTDEGVDAVVALLQRENILAPITKLTPIATLKDYC